VSVRHSTGPKQLGNKIRRYGISATDGQVATSRQARKKARNALRGTKIGKRVQSKGNGVDGGTFGWSGEGPRQREALLKRGEERSSGKRKERRQEDP